jgi:hypothetical protein
MNATGAAHKGPIGKSKFLISKFQFDSRRGDPRLVQ